MVPVTVTWWEYVKTINTACVYYVLIFFRCRSSYAFMLPVSTPPNAIAFAAAKMKPDEMVSYYVNEMICEKLILFDFNRWKRAGLSNWSALLWYASRWKHGVMLYSAANIFPYGRTSRLPVCLNLFPDAPIRPFRSRFRIHLTWLSGVKFRDFLC